MDVGLPDPWAPPGDVFEAHVGRFLDWPATCEYLNGVANLAKCFLERVGTLDAVQAAFKLMVHFLRMDHKDFMSVHRAIPAVMLRLDLDQECCDWVTGCIEHGFPGMFNETAPNLIFENKYDPDRFLEVYPPVGEVCEAWPSPLLVRGVDVLEWQTPLRNYIRFPHEHRLSALLLTMKLIVDVRNISVARKVLPRLPLPIEVRREVERNVTRSPISAARFHNLPGDSLAGVEAKLVAQACKLGNETHGRNPLIFRHLLDPAEILSEPPEGPVAYEDKEAAAYALHACFDAWRETELVLDLLEDARVCAAEDRFRARVKTLSKGKLRQCTRLMWRFLGDAVENASYLGDNQSKPSWRSLVRRKNVE